MSTLFSKQLASFSVSLPLFHNLRKQIVFQTANPVSVYVLTCCIVLNNSSTAWCIFIKMSYACCVIKTNTTLLLTVSV
jgi:hypothetical protein